MNIELREDSVVISGYVNAIERYSKPIRGILHGQLKTFVERIKSGTFKNALKKNDDVLVLLNHDHSRKLAETRDGTAVLSEDNIGLKATVTVTDAEVMQKAKEGRLSGWSFGMYVNDDTIGTENGIESRTINDMDLVEISILDDTKNPAYYGTSIETRSEDEKLEYRATSFKQNEEDERIEAIATRLFEKLSGLIVRDDSQVEEQKATEETKQVEEPKQEIDYSEYENRLKDI